MKKKNGQSILEYVIILSAIVAAILVGRTMVGKSVKQGLTDTTTAMNNATGKLPGLMN